MRYRILVGVIPFLLPLTAIAADSPGATPLTAIQVCEPIGEQAYIMQLVCPTGDAPAFKRKGNVGPREELTKEDADYLLKNPGRGYARLAPGQRDLHWIDEYELTCKNQPPQKIYMDMYHCGIVNNPAPPQGFRMNINPSILTTRNANFHEPLDVEAKTLIDQILDCRITMLYASKLPNVTNAAAMRKLYPRLQIAAYMVGATADYDHAFADIFRSNLPAKPTLDTANDLIKIADLCLIQFSNRPELHLWEWKSEAMSKVYPES